MKKMGLVIGLILWVQMVIAQQVKVDLAMADVLYRGGVAAKHLEMELGHMVMRMEFDRIFETEHSYRYLSRNTSYQITVLGDYRVEKVRLKLYKMENGAWDLVKSNSGDDYMTYVFYTPPEDGLYRFTIEVDLNDGYKDADYCLIVSID